MTQESKLKLQKCEADGCNRAAILYFNKKKYCNKHWLRLYNNGALKLKGKKIRCKYFKGENYATGITSKGITFKFSNSDWGLVTKHSWTTNKANYLVATINQRIVRLSRFLMKPSRSMVVDHINGDVLDNRRENLRIITQKNNSRNAKVSINNTSGFTGVRIVHLSGGETRYKARIFVDGKEISLGTYDTIDEAILARKKGEIKYFGKYSATKSRNKAAY